MLEPSRDLVDSKLLSSTRGAPTKFSRVADVIHMYRAVLGTCLLIALSTIVSQPFHSRVVIEQQFRRIL